MPIFANSGKLLQSLAVATSHGSFLSLDQIIYNGIGFTIAAASTAAITIYAKKALQKLQAEDEIFWAHEVQAQDETHNASFLSGVLYMNSCY